MNSPIKKHPLGRSGIEISEIGLGMWAIGGDAWGPVDDKESLNVIDASLERGINFFDTSDVYGAGHSEEILGQAMKGRRDKFIVATKIGWQNFDGDKRSTAYTTVQKLIEGVETNLSRLKTDVIDLIQSHIDFRESTMEIFVEGFEKLKSDGKIRAYGLSTSNFEYLKEFNGGGGMSSLQCDYSILNRTAESEIFPYCKKYGIGTIIRGPLAMGILTGKFHKDSTFDKNDWRKRWLDNPDENKVFLNDLSIVEKLKAITNGRSLAELSLQFVLSNENVSSVIPGIKTVKQLEQNTTNVIFSRLSDEDKEKVSEITPVGGGRKIWPA